MTSKYKKSPSYARIQLGALMLIKDHNLPPLRWVTSPIVQTYSSKDSITRISEVKTNKGLYRRVQNKLCVFRFLS